MQATGSLPAAASSLIYDHIPVRVTPAKAGAPKIKGTPLRPRSGERRRKGAGIVFALGSPPRLRGGESRSSEVSEF